jgi:hypothetical protein
MEALIFDEAFLQRRQPIERQLTTEKSSIALPQSHNTAIKMVNQRSTGVASYANETNLSGLFRPAEVDFPHT